MSKRIQQLPAGFRNSTLLEIHYAVSEQLPQLYHYLAVATADFEGLQVKTKEEGVLVIAKRVNPDGKPEVLFCSGYDALSALVDLERALAAGKWREDKPWQGYGNGEVKEKKK